jgi:protein phosphatase 2C family protein 2/3
LNIVRPKNKDENERWPKCSFFGIFDGHGGSLCADYLRDNLHHFIVRDENFPKNPRVAIKRGFEEAEKCFLEYAQCVNSN